MSNYYISSLFKVGAISYGADKPMLIDCFEECLKILSDPSNESTISSSFISVMSRTKWFAFFSCGFYFINLNFDIYFLFVSFATDSEPDMVSYSESDLDSLESLLLEKDDDFLLISSSFY